METRTVRAISAFTAFVGSMKVFNHAVVDADGKVIAKATEGELPEKMAQGYVDAGMAEFVVVKPGKAAAKAAPASTADVAAAPVAPPPAETAFVATYKPVGMYEITGPGLIVPEIVKGKEARDTRLAQLNEPLDPGAPVD